MVPAAASRRAHATASMVAVALLLTFVSPAQGAKTNSPSQLFAQALAQVSAILAPPTNQAPRTFTTALKVIKAQGLPKETEGRQLDLAFQAPDHVRFSLTLDRQSYTACRDEQELWVYAPGKKFGLIGSPEKALFSTAPEIKDQKPLGPLKLPIPAEQLALLPFLIEVKALPDESVGATPCRVLTATAKPEAVDALKLPQGTLQLWLRASDLLPLRLAYREGKGTDVEVELANPQFEEAWPAERWKLKADAGGKISTVARSHLTRFLNVAISMLGEKIPTLGPATGERRLVAREGNGRLEVGRWHTCAGPERHAGGNGPPARRAHEEGHPPTGGPYPVRSGRRHLVRGR